ncbi:nitric oxide reductase activation protein NorD [Caenispirillum salinarum]|uniref:nitric oxide reductase activation protein NorD n=1 Tax=Caenispirillum salinarum TaxID=859058 RepID=UPI00384CDF82
MTADDLEDLRTAAPDLAGTLDATVHEASRIFSPAGLTAWLDGARALAGLGRGSELVATYMEAMPQVARECGEDVVPDCVTAVMKLSSMTSGEVLTLVFATLPSAAARMADADLLRGYLALLHRLSAKAPRGLRPMLENLDELLGKLTLSGLRRWADFGAEAYGRDLTRQAAYFGLQSEDSKAVLQAERRGTLFVDSQRRLNFTLMAFWARAFFLRPAAADTPGFRPFIEDRALHLPDAVDAVGEVSGIDVYRAMAAHMAAQIVHTPAPPPGRDLAPAARFLVGYFEDARVEAAAAREFPGLKRLWLSLMPAAGTPHPEHDTMPLLERLAVALLDPEAHTGDAPVDAIADRFHGAAEQTPDLSQDLAVALFDLLTERKALPSLRILETLRIPYRDDNRFLWATDAVDWRDATAWVPDRKDQVRRRVGLMEFINEVDTETAGDDAQEIWTLDGELFPYEDDGVSYNAREGREPVSDPVHYPEWDYQVQLYRPNWTTVTERRQPRGDPATIDALLTAHKGVTHRIRQIVDRLRPQGIVRQRRLEDGDDLDINAAVDAMVMLRLGRDPDPRITQRWVINRRDLCALVLLDLSESTNDPVRGEEDGEGREGRTVLDLTREACALVATAVDGIGDPFAIHGFASDGRHDVRYTRFKDFDQPFEVEAKSRLAGMRGGLSTRMGAAMRHAGRHLRRRAEKHKLLLVLTDGEPADIDERDPQYLRHDARNAVEDLRAAGIAPYCLSLDPLADQYVARIFGGNAYTVVDHVQRLPEKLPTLFAALTR